MPQRKHRPTSSGATPSQQPPPLHPHPPPRAAQPASAPSSTPSSSSSPRPQRQIHDPRNGASSSSSSSDLADRGGVAGGSKVGVGNANGDPGGKPSHTDKTNGHGNHHYNHNHNQHQNNNNSSHKHPLQHSGNNKGTSSKSANNKQNSGHRHPRIPLPKATKLSDGPAKLLVIDDVPTEPGGFSTSEASIPSYVTWVRSSLRLHRELEIIGIEPALAKTTSILLIMSETDWRGDRLGGSEGAVLRSLTTVSFETPTREPRIGLRATIAAAAAGGAGASGGD